MSELPPSWLEKHKKKGTQITKIGKNYYLYKVSSHWSAKKKRSIKVTEKYLGRITEEGIIPPKTQIVEEKYSQIGVKEYAASYFLHSISSDILSELKKHYPSEWKELFILAIMRLLEKSPLKNIYFYYKNSYISEIIKNAKISDKYVGHFLRIMGSRREPMKDYMRSFMVGAEYAIVDLTHIFSYSKGVMNAMLGHNKDLVYTPQINLLMIYSLDKLQPVYFRQIPGAIRDVSSVIKTVNETVTENFIFIGDKGLHSDDNVEEMQENHIDYVLALKRDSRYISYDKIKIGDKKEFDGYFLYQKRQIWYCYNILNKDEKIMTYLDQSLKAQEENDLAIRIDKLKEKSKEKGLIDAEYERLTKYKKRLYDTSYRNGTLSVRTNVKKSPQEVYNIMKSRVNVEQAFDTFKNVLDADRTYMRDDKQMEGWLFINFIALQLYYKIYAILLNKEMLNKYSPMDILNQFKRIYMLKIKGGWQLAEITKKARDLAKKTGLDIPIT